MKQLIKQYVSFLALVVIFTACEKKQELFILPPPQITLINASAQTVQRPGGNVVIDVELKAAGILDSFIITENGLPYSQESLAAQNRLVLSKTIEYQVDPARFSNGDRILLEMSLFDTKGNSSATIRYQVQVAPPFIIKDTVLYSQPFVYVKGEINENLVLEPDVKYFFDSVVAMVEGADMTVPAGTHIYMRHYTQQGPLSKLVFTQGSQFIVNGTREQPVVITSERTLTNNAVTADWGGIFIYGRAATNQATQILEDGYRYGGSMPSDNSGSIRYLRVEYAGKEGSDAFNLLGVGSGTRVEYVQVYDCLDNAIRLKGGNADIKYMMATRHSAYGIWIEHGWQGRAQFLICQTNVKATLFPVNFWNQARSLEIRSDENNFFNEPRTRFAISNVTLIGNGYASGVDNGTRRGLRVRRGASGKLHNVIVTNFPDDAVRVEDVPSTELGTDMVLSHVTAYNNNLQYNEQAEDYFLPLPGSNLVTTPVPGITANEYAASLPSSFNPAVSLGGWFSNASFIGAVENAASDWTRGWTRNMDGTLRQ